MLCVECMYACMRARDDCKTQCMHVCLHTNMHACVHVWGACVLVAVHAVNAVKCVLVDACVHVWVQVVFACGAFRCKLLKCGLALCVAICWRACTYEFMGGVRIFVCTCECEHVWAHARVYCNVGARLRVSLFAA